MSIVVAARPQPLLRTPLTAPDLLDILAGATPARLDELLFGVIGFGSDGRVMACNVSAQRLSGIAGGDALGADLFTQIAPCADNLMVRERFRRAWERGVELDVELRFAFSYPMKYLRVVLRLLSRGQRGWLAFTPV